MLESILYCLFTSRVAWDRSNLSRAGLIWSESSAVHFRLVLKSAARSVSICSLELKENSASRARHGRDYWPEPLMKINSPSER